MSTTNGGEAGFCFHPADEQHLRGGSVSPCFHPGDANVNLCHHPSDNVNMCYHPVGDDLAADLHLSLTGIDERHLAALRP
ncbi:hypothetical protein AB0J74_17900 [Asanoa sp. NPDC049573]|uniref:hypothetical protein n=1 Tax=Asanoa sp. NPDC049573 TaxID=3155396 RepID=UPI00342C4A61